MEVLLAASGGGGAAPRRAGRAGRPACGGFGGGVYEARS